MFGKANQSQLKFPNPADGETQDGDVTSISPCRLLRRDATYHAKTSRSGLRIRPPIATLSGGADGMRGQLPVIALPHPELQSRRWTSECSFHLTRCSGHSEGKFT